MLYIIKRNGQKEGYEPDKIINAVRKAFKGTGSQVSEEELKDILRLTETKTGILEAGDELPGITVEAIQDKVEEALMERGHFAEARAYILYRRKRTELRDARRFITDSTGAEGLSDVLLRIEKDFPGEEYSLLRLSE